VAVIKKKVVKQWRGNYATDDGPCSAVLSFTRTLQLKSYRCTIIPTY